MKFYSDNQVDRIVAPLLPEFGYAVDVGANDGLILSNSLHFEDKGWYVLCVEPNPELAGVGRKRRKLWRELACGAEDHDAMPFTYYGGYPYASNSSLGPRHGYMSNHAGITSQVKVRRLDTLLEEAGFPRLDYLTIDVEGWEQEVLAGLSLDRWQPLVIVSEDLFGKYPSPPGYDEVGRYEFDRVFQRKA